MAGPRKTDEQKIEEINRKIADYENKIDALKEKKEAIQHPLTYQDIIKEAKKQKLTPKKLAEALGMRITPEKNDQEAHPEESDQGE